MKKVTMIFAIMILSATVAFGQCNNRVKIDEFTGERITHTPTFGNPMVMMKVEKDDQTMYFLRLTSYGATLNSGTGIILLFEDGTKWERPDAEIGFDRGPGGANRWEYTAFVQISEKDLELFMTKKVKKYRLYVYEMNPGPSRNKFVTNVKCLF